MQTPSSFIQRLEQAAALSPLLATVWLAFSPLPAHAALTDIAPAPLANSANAVVKPNILMILDDSGSMNSEFMPDYVADNNGTWCKKATDSTSGQTLVSCDEGDVPFYAAAFNGLAYNPAVRYLPAVNADTSSRTSYNTPALWAAVPSDAYDVQFSHAITNLTQDFPDIMFCQDSSSTSDRRAPYLSGQCKHALAMGTGTQAWTYPDGGFSNRLSVSLSTDPLLARAPYFYTIASVQWCNAKDGLGFGSGSCQAKKTSTFKWPQYGAISRTDIVQNEVTSKYPYIIATDAACTASNGNNQCGTFNGATGGSCPNGRFRKQTTTTTAYRTTVTRGARVISDSGVPASGSFGSPVVTFSGSCGTNSSGTTGSGNLGFRSPNPSAIALGSSTPDTQTTTTLTYPKVAARADCSGSIGSTGCSFTEEMTNFANWYAYYRSRMQMMKTASGLAFKTLNQNYRIGFITINPGSNIGSSKYLAIAPFEGAQRTSWYNVFYSQAPGPSTPLRQALARAGRYFAGKGPSDTSAASGLNRGMNDDPIQYSCQQNFAILSTDGLWNESDSTVVSINGSTLVGNPDGVIASAPRPLFDGSSTTEKTTTTTTTQIICTGDEPIFGGASTCGCTTDPNFKRVVENASDSIVAVNFLGGTQQGSPVTTVNPNITTLKSCNAKQTGTRTPQTQTEIKVCRQGVSGSQATFTDGTTVSCSTCNSSKGFLVKQTKGMTLSSIAYDGGTPVVSTSIDSTALTYSTGSSYGSSKPSGSSCTSSALTGSTLSSSNGTPVAVNTGTARTTADFTIGPTATPPTASNPKIVVGATTTTLNTGTANTLADVAQYYYITDLRGGKDAFGNATGPATSPSTTPTAGGDVSENNVKGQTAGNPMNDSAVHQHMTTFTVGLGVDGTLTYASDYKENPTGDFLLINNGTNAWPTPVSNTDTTVDDLWHAGVNGRGKYLSARDPSQLTSGLSEALTSVNAVVGAAAAAATSNLEPVAGDNFAYIASYETVRWNGEVEARTIDLNSGTVSSVNEWSAQTQLDTLANSTSPGGTNRKIWRLSAGAAAVTGTGGNLQAFTYANLDPTTEQIYFQAGHLSGADGSVYPALTQWTTLFGNGMSGTAVGSNLVNFIRGDGSLEDNTANPAANRVFRDRAHVLGDIVNAQPVFVKKTSLGYTDANYVDFQSCINNGGSAGSCTTITGTDTARPATVYISANDGMLHALNGDTGAERWAYIPNMLMPKLYRLADSDYKTAINHQWMVDGSPSVGDIYDGAKWRTVLVGGLNGGERGYYALDVTDPAKPKGLWEFKVRTSGGCTFAVNDTTDCDLGYSYGNPILTKLGDGTWVVMIPSGYNNVNPGDGKGYLYVLDPITGKIKKKIALCSAAPQSPSICPGDTTTPMGFARINNWVDDSNSNNTTLRVYGGDLVGNLWRVDADAGVAYVVAQLNDGAATPAAQPVTTKPELGQVTGSSGTADMIYIGTGKYLGSGDTTTTQKQTIYAIKDSTNGTAPVLPINARGSTVTSQTLQDTTDATGAAVRTVTNTPVSVTSAGVDGWRVDLPVQGERVNVDMKLQLGTLIVGSNVPANNACNAGGFSFLNFFDYRTGSYIPSAGSNIAGQRVGNSLLVGINVVRLPNNKTVAIATTSDNQHPTLYPPFQSPNPVGRRVGWKELSE